MDKKKQKQSGKLPPSGIVWNINSVTTGSVIRYSFHGYNKVSHWAGWEDSKANPIPFPKGALAWQEGEVHRGSSSQGRGALCHRDLIGLLQGWVLLKRDGRWAPTSQLTRWGTSVLFKGNLVNHFFCLLKSHVTVNNHVEVWYKPVPPMYSYSTAAFLAAGCMRAGHKSFT